jgi:hypothetical protein
MVTGQIVAQSTAKEVTLKSIHIGAVIAESDDRSHISIEYSVAYAHRGREMLLLPLLHNEKTIDDEWMIRGLVLSAEVDVTGVYKRIGTFVIQGRSVYQTLFHSAPILEERYYKTKFGFDRYTICII